MNIKSPFTWLTTALILAFATPAMAEAAPKDAAPLVAKNKDKRRKNKRRKNKARKQRHQMTPAELQAMVARRLGKMGKRVDKATKKRRIPPAVAARLKTDLATGSRDVNGALNAAVKDGKLSKGEARRVRIKLKALRTQLQMQMPKKSKKANQRRVNKRGPKKGSKANARRANPERNRQRREALKRRRAAD